MLQRAAQLLQHRQLALLLRRRLAERNVLLGQLQSLCCGGRTLRLQRGAVLVGLLQLLGRLQWISAMDGWIVQRPG